MSAVPATQLDARAGVTASDAGASMFDVRPYTLLKPSRAAAPSPLVMMLHGYSATGAKQEAGYFHLTPASEKNQFLYAYPDATPDCDGQLSWNATDACCRFCSPPVDDVAYLVAVLDDIAAKAGSDPKRVFVIGHSNGGYMAHRLACDRASRVAAVVSFAGAQWQDASRCQPSEPVSIVQIHGDLDVQRDANGNYGTGYEGGTAKAPYPSAHQTVATWAKKDGCTGPLADTGKRLTLLAGGAGGETKVEAYRGCPDGIAVELWTIVGGHHMDALNRDTFGEAVWAFMSAHPKR